MSINITIISGLTGSYPFDSHGLEKNFPGLKGSSFQLLFTGKHRKMIRRRKTLPVSAGHLLSNLPVELNQSFLVFPMSDLILQDLEDLFGENLALVLCGERTINLAKRNVSQEKKERQSVKLRAVCRFDANLRRTRREKC